MLDELDVAFKKQLMYKQIKLNKLTSRLKNIITKNDAIYLKASRSMKFENIVKSI